MTQSFDGPEPTQTPGKPGQDSQSTSGFRYWVFELDRILRGEATKPQALQRTEIRIPIVGISVIVILLAMTYGACMGIFALVRGVENSEYQQALLQTFASMSKVPLLFSLTLLITFPSLYVFNALVGSQLRCGSVLKLLLASLAVNLAVLASMGPILAFFSVSTPSYSFIVILNVVAFAIAGLLGLTFLIQTLNRLANTDHRLQSVAQVQAPQRLAEPVTTGDSEGTAPRSQNLPASAPLAVTVSARSTNAGSGSPGPLDPVEGHVLGAHVRTVFTCWIVLFGFVGAQMGWVLRPFIGAPGSPFQWFRPRESNFFQAVFETLQNLFA